MLPILPGRWSVYGKQPSRHKPAAHRTPKPRQTAWLFDFHRDAQYESSLDANCQSIRTLIRDARHGVYDRVLVMNGDRLARDAEGLAAIGEKLTAAGVRVYCPDGEIDLAPAYSHGYFRVATMEQTM